MRAASTPDYLQSFGVRTPKDRLRREQPSAVFAGERRVHFVTCQPLVIRPLTRPRPSGQSAAPSRTLNEDYRPTAALA
jgi:hypothetical protein